jgi:hypothetical protein
MDADALREAVLAATSDDTAARIRAAMAETQRDLIQQIGRTTDGSTLAETWYALVDPTDEQMRLIQEPVDAAIRQHIDEAVGFLRSYSERQGNTIEVRGIVDGAQAMKSIKQTMKAFAKRNRAG